MSSQIIYRRCPKNSHSTIPPVQGERPIWIRYKASGTLMQPQAILLGLNFLDISYGQKYFLLAAHQIEKSQKMSSCGGNLVACWVSFSIWTTSTFPFHLCVSHSCTLHKVYVDIVYMSTLSTVTDYWTVRSTFQFHQTPTLGA